MNSNVIDDEEIAVGPCLRRNAPAKSAQTKKTKRRWIKATRTSAPIAQSEKWFEGMVLKGPHAHSRH